MEDEYIQGATKPKVELLLLMTLFGLPYLLLLLGAITDPNSLYTDALTTKERESILFDALNLKVFVNGYLLIIYSMVSVYVYILARKTHISCQFPPPGVTMPFKTKIIKDKKALHNAYATYFFSAMMLLNGTVQFGTSVHMLHFIKSTLNVI
jgi:hypothetical protein